MMQQFHAKEICLTDGRTMSDKIFSISNNYVLIKENDDSCLMISVRLVDEIRDVVSIRSKQRVAYF